MVRRSPQRLRENVARRIAEVRRAAGLTQAALALRLDCSRNYAQRLESGENLSLETLAAVALALGVDPIVFFERPATKRPAAGRPRGAASPR